MTSSYSSSHEFLRSFFSAIPWIALSGWCLHNALSQSVEQIGPLFALALAIGISFLFLSRPFPSASGRSLPRAVSYAVVALPFFSRFTCILTPALVLTWLGAMLMIVSLFAMGPSFALSPLPRPLVRNSVYRFIRHPWFLGLTLFSLGYFFNRPDVLNGLISLFTLLAVVYLIRVEETEMSGAAFQSYADRVRYRLIPGLF